METVKQIITKKVELRKLRRKAGISLRELSRLSGVSFGHIHRIENGMTMTEKTWNKLNKPLINLINKQTHEHRKTTQ